MNIQQTKPQNLFTAVLVSKPDTVRMFSILEVHMKPATVQSQNEKAQEKRHVFKFYQYEKASTKEEMLSK